MYIVKASDLDHSWPALIDHQNPELNPCCFVMYVKCYQNGFRMEVLQP
jgi:hypothetical protein